MVDSLMRDLVLALRQMRTAPRFTVAAAAALALGIGAATSIFSVINAVLIRPLPYAEADRLVWVGEVLKRNTIDEVTLTPNFLEWRRQNRTFTAMAAYNAALRTLIANGEATQLRTLKASAALLAVLKTEPLLGRPFLAGEDRNCHDQVAILSYHLWQQAFGGNKEVIGWRPLACTVSCSRWSVRDFARLEFAWQWVANLGTLFGWYWAAACSSWPSGS